ncbi:ester hydrolase [Malassezia pachydermatis]|uniref:Gdsl family lipase n=1 Tax=Malassezia pachydermatis TaxID=77020 RepID=A0A0M8MXY6_9BASI|nr:gdsl family lipase [Malassezia pachydermatis]KOS15801.1 gdsl family lipase [Malassezia pachydermatis]
MWPLSAGILALLSATCALALPTTPLLEERATSTNYTSIVVFGDSLVDNGNGTYLLSNKTWPSDRAYFDGRFSNGETWPEQLANLLHVPHVHDFAYGGATTNNSAAQGYSDYNSTLPVPDVIHQVGQYLDLVNGTADPSGIYIVSGGSNDVFFGTAKTLDLFGLAETAVRTLEAEARRLIRHGAKTIVFPTLSDMTKTPAALHYSNLIDIVGSTLFVDHFNKVLRSAAHDVSRDATVYIFDLHEAVGRIKSHKKRYGLDNVSDACLQGTTKPEVEKGVKRHVCNNPDAYFFWDIYHPTAQAHKLLGDAALPLFS